MEEVDAANGRGDVLYVVIPAYNEEANINRCIDDWYPVVQKHGGGAFSPCNRR